MDGNQDIFCYQKIYFGFLGGFGFGIVGGKVISKEKIMFVPFHHGARRSVQKFVQNHRMEAGINLPQIFHVFRSWVDNINPGEFIFDDFHITILVYQILTILTALRLCAYRNQNSFSPADKLSSPSSDSSAYGETNLNRTAGSSVRPTAGAPLENNNLFINPIINAMARIIGRHFVSWHQSFPSTVN